MDSEQMILPNQNQSYTFEDIIGFDNNSYFDLRCVICLDLIINPVKCKKCNKHFCYQCIAKQRNESKICPYRCSEEDMQIDGPNKDIRKLLSQQKIACKQKGCGQIIKLTELTKHHQQYCKHIVLHCPYLGCLYFTRRQDLDKHFDNCELKHADYKQYSKIQYKVFDQKQMFKEFVSMTQNNTVEALKLGYQYGYAMQLIQGKQFDDLAALIYYIAVMCQQIGDKMALKYFILFENLYEIPQYRNNNNYQQVYEHYPSVIYFIFNYYQLDYMFSQSLDYFGIFVIYISLLF